MSDTIFDLEQQIMDCWHIVDDLKILTDSILEREMTKDDIANITLGLEKLYQLKFEKLFEMFEMHCKEYHTYRKMYETSKTISEESKISNTWKEYND